MKVAVAAIGSLFLPGLGQLFYEEWGWAVGWFLLSLTSCGLANIASAFHVILISSDGEYGSLAQ